MQQSLTLNLLNKGDFQNKTYWHWHTQKRILCVSVHKSTETTGRDGEDEALPGMRLVIFCSVEFCCISVVYFRINVWNIYLIILVFYSLADVVFCLTMLPHMCPPGSWLLQLFWADELNEYKLIVEHSEWNVLPHI